MLGHLLCQMLIAAHSCARLKHVLDCSDVLVCLTSVSVFVLAELLAFVRPNLEDFGPALRAPRSGSHLPDHPPAASLGTLFPSYDNTVLSSAAGDICLC